MWRVFIRLSPRRAGRNDSMAEVYFILGAEGAGRREIIRDLIEGGFDEDEGVAVGMQRAEPESSDDAPLANRAATAVFAYDDLRQASPPLEVEAIFLVAPGRGNPLDAVEALSDWLHATGHTLARIITIVHCRLLHDHPKLEIWHRACIHFSDAVLLNRREDVPNKWFTEFRQHYEQEAYPCLFELVKKGRVKNPALILEPQSRRLSLAFDPDIDAIDMLDLDEDNLPEEPIDLTRPTDPWLKRLPSGHWERSLPDISEYLSPSLQGKTSRKGRPNRATGQTR